MKNKKLFVMVIGLVFVALILAACSSSKSGFPTGRFLDADIVGYSAKEGGFKFNTDGTWHAFSGEYILSSGTYSVDGDLYIEETNNGGCAVPMSFNYSYDGTSLKFELTDQSQDDTCGGRRQAFDGKTYLLSK